MTETLIVANWKMNGDKKCIKSLLKEWSNNIKNINLKRKRIIICPSYPYLNFVDNTLNQYNLPFSLGAQNCYEKKIGAFTGEVSPQMLVNLDVEYVILGHSERRQLFFETDMCILNKVKICLECGLKVIWCCGETLTQKEYSLTFKVLEYQLSYLQTILSDMEIKNVNNFIIAYEPVWAIGTGRSATTEDIYNVVSKIKNYIKKFNPIITDHIKILYGGSVKKNNVDDLKKINNIDGFLVGGASLTRDFINIIE
uniref:triose-phosphate isomerase n=1 Tax=Megaviridae environmental sample TaxID=1737588 RepID=A0A5J6VKU0_9VIRU|nr:MAG: triosephosphate isomerase [Megaviridae environmental sample]